MKGHSLDVDLDVAGKMFGRERERPINGGESRSENMHIPAYLSGLDSARNFEFPFRLLVRKLVD